MAIPKPPRQSRLKVAPPADPQPITTSIMSLEDKALVDMNFKVSPKMRAMVKVQAGSRGMSTKAMIEAALRHYWASFPVDPVQVD
jgi:hypothetical protein